MIRDFEAVRPQLAEGCFIADSALVLGDVALGEDASVWYGAIVRGDVNSIRIGARTNLQDACVVHVTSERHATTVGQDVTVGHGAILHGCTIADTVLVGIRATVLDGAEIGEGSIVAAGALVPPGKQFPPRVLLRGSPATEIRAVNDDEQAWIRRSAARYFALARSHAALGRPPSK